MHHKERLALITKLHVDVDRDAVDGDVHEFLRRAQDLELAKAHVERRAGQCAVLLLDDDDVDGARQSCGVDVCVEGAHGRDDTDDLH